MTRDVGAHVAAGVTVFRVWAPVAGKVAVLVESCPRGRRIEMIGEGGGYFVASAAVPAGERYRYLLDDGEAYPDPASRFQPDGPYGPSEIIDPSRFVWTDGGWQGPDADDVIVYEVHVGTFSPGGTWRAAVDRLPDLHALGVTTIELMPVADFPGRFGWGYDGVHLFAPSHQYGRPDDLRTFVNRAHDLGLAVILDVVYNHAGPDGCWLERFAPQYFSTRRTDWGRGFNVDGPESAPVRAFFEQNARYWIAEFHLDGLRFDATDQIVDQSAEHLVASATRAARAAAGGRRIWVVAENESQDSRLVRSTDEGGHGLDAVWNDDFHHSAHVAATGTHEGYYTDYRGRAPEFAAATRGFLYQGQWYSWQQRPRGSSAAGVPPRAFVACLENHDQVANSLDGARLHALASPSVIRVLTAMLLLGPWTPMLFQGQELHSSSPFLYFADHRPPLSQSVFEGRRAFLSQFPTIEAALRAGFQLDRPDDEATFTRSCIDTVARTPAQRQALALHTSLIAIRRQDPVIRAAGHTGVDTAVLGPRAWVMRYRAPLEWPEAGDRLLVLNLGRQLDLDVVPEPLLAPRHRSGWRLVWHTEDEQFGPPTTSHLRFHEQWHIPEVSAWLLAD